MNYATTPLKHCPFCGSKAKRTGGTLGDITITSCRCSNIDCIASFKSVDYSVWNTRIDKNVADSTTTRQWIEDDKDAGFMEKE